MGKTILKPSQKKAVCKLKNPDQVGEKRAISFRFWGPYIHIGSEYLGKHHIKCFTLPASLTFVIDQIILPQIYCSYLCCVIFTEDSSVNYEYSSCVFCPRY